MQGLLWVSLACYEQDRSKIHQNKIVFAKQGMQLLYTDLVACSLINKHFVPYFNDNMVLLLGELVMDKIINYNGQFKINS